jgi:hypothetical protein
VDGNETAVNNEVFNEFVELRLKPAKLLFVNLGIVKERRRCELESLQAMSYTCEFHGLNNLGKPA